MRMNSYFKWMGSTAIAALLSACGIAPEADVPNERFVIYYSHLADASQLEGYQLLVFDPQAYPNMKPLDDAQTMLGYVSLGEAKPGTLSEEEQHLAIREHPVWKSQLVDIRQDEWKTHILDQQVPSVLEQGFDGVMLDTVDSSLHLEQSEPEQYAGMSDAAVQLIKQIRANHPDAKIMLNRGFAIWARVAPVIDMVLVESIASDYDFEKQKATMRKEADYESQLRQIRTISKQYPHLKFYSIDYWDMDDDRGVRMLYEQQRKNGMVPYVATPALDTVYEEPDTNPWPSMKKHPALYGGFDA